MSERIALGFGNNIDYEIVWDSRILEAMVLRHGIRSDELSLDRAIESERDLVISILSFVRAGIGGERSVSSSSIVEGFSQHFSKKITLGGTSVRAALAMKRLGHTSALHLVTLNDDVRRLLPRGCPYVCSSRDDSLHPHLIVQFDEGVRVEAGDIHICARQPNRIIYHDDIDNIAMRLDERFSVRLASAKVLLVSGFNAMQSETLLIDRLDTLLTMMKSLPLDALVYYEEAGFYESSFSSLIHQKLAGHLDIVGLNEDELQGYLGRTLDLLDITQVAAALKDLQELIQVPVIVVHCKHWALAYGRDAGGFREALKGGVTMATTRFRYGDDFTEAHYRNFENTSPGKAGAAFSAATNELLGSSVCCVPVARVEQSKGTMVGLGDAFVGGFLPLLAAQSRLPR